MAVYNGFPATYQPYIPYQQPLTPVQQPQQPQPVQQSGNGLVWVQGENAAKSYPVAPNNTVLLMDSEGDRFYLKSADASGMPLPLRTFVYSEQTAQPAPKAAEGEQPAFATKTELDALRADMEELKMSIAPKRSRKQKEVEADG